jgi:hypothetical protein
MNNEIIIQELPTIHYANWSAELPFGIVKSLAQQIEKEDTDKENITSSLDTINTENVVGLLTLSIPEEMNIKSKTFAIIESDDYYRTTFGPMHNDLPLASLILLAPVENDVCIILINSKARKMSFDKNMSVMIHGILGHEVGHYLAGHLLLSKEEKREMYALFIDDFEGVVPDENTPEYWEMISQCLIKGGINELEAEANRYGASVVGIAPMIAMMSYHAELSDTVGNRLHFRNLISTFICEMEDHRFLIDDYKDILIDWYILTDEELSELHNKNSAIRTVLSNKRRRGLGVKKLKETEVPLKYHEHPKEITNG